MTKRIHLVFLFTLFCVSVLKSQNQQPYFTLKGSVVEEKTDAPIPRVNVEIVLGEYTTTNRAGEFKIKARVGDQLIVSSDDFQTVYYTIRDQQNVKIKVQEEESESEVMSPISKSVSNREASNHFKKYMDSAQVYLKKDAPKSIEYVTRALQSTGNSRASASENSQAFEALGDINTFWQQYDLAIDNYKSSLRAQQRTDVRIKLASAFMMDKKYQESISEYKKLLSSGMSTYQKVSVYEGLGDVYKAISDHEKSVFNYKSALKLAQQHSISPKITDLNSKIAEAYAKVGNTEKAQDFFGNSLKLAERENKKRAAVEKNKVADFYSQNRNFEDEIQLRQETLSEIEDLDFEDTSAPENDENLTAQRQNYKIANAYIAQDKYEEAIPFLKKSIEEANEKEDLVVQKDATRKLSEIYRDIGDFEKAEESYQDYVSVVDELYIKKEQELSQAARFSREMALKQSRIASLENERELNESRYSLAFQNQELIEKNNRVQQWIIGSLVCIAILLLFTAYTQYKSVKRQKFTNNQLALKSLRTQMNPHFIFNALNSVNSFIAGNDERAANAYLTEFSTLMRSVLENSDEDFISLQKEIELLQSYVKLEHFRFKDKFDYQITIDESLNTQEFLIPPMLLQPYVENAVWHGLRYKKEKGNLWIDFKQIDSEIVKITIEDDGIGRRKSKELKTEHQKKQKSKGMGNIKKRIAILNEMYHDKVDVFVEDVFEEGEGTRVILTLKKES